jgi:hypothetical protein
MIHTGSDIRIILERRQVDGINIRRHGDCAGEEGGVVITVGIADFAWITGFVVQLDGKFERSHRLFTVERQRAILVEFLAAKGPQHQTWHTVTVAAGLVGEGHAIGAPLGLERCAQGQCFLPGVREDVVAFLLQPILAIVDKPVVLAQWCAQPFAVFGAHLIGGVGQVTTPLFAQFGGNVGDIDQGIGKDLGRGAVLDDIGGAAGLNGGLNLGQQLGIALKVDGDIVFSAPFGGKLINHHIEIGQEGPGATQEIDGRAFGRGCGRGICCWRTGRRSNRRTGSQRHTNSHHPGALQKGASSNRLRMCSRHKQLLLW